ncbi:MAG TPA: IS110 family transposase [Thermoleophilaceae bacterium]|nr:IS110 family transposase [Thermoleophilaceae bacterium]
MPAICGIDWAAEWHDVRIADSASGEPLAERRFEHTEQGIAGLVGLIAGRDVECVAIERPEGVLVGRLLAAGITVLAIHPNQVSAARDRFRAAAGKSDRFDAFVLCELARTDRHRFHPLAPSGDETVALRTLCRTREDLVEARVGLANQLRAQLDACWPGARRIFADVDSPIGLAFLARYPAPADAHRLGPARLQGFLDRHGYCGRRPVDELLERLRSSPIAEISDAQAEAQRATVLALVAVLRPLVEQISQLTSQIKGAIRAHPDGPIFLSFFKDPKSAVTAAGLLAEIGDNRARYPTPQALCADAGQAPVAIESGKHRNATFRWACDKRLRAHVGVLSDSTRHWHPWAHDVYHRALARGQNHPHACRTLGRAWLLILWRCWQDGQPYDPAKHRNLTRLLQTRG